MATGDMTTGTPLGRIVSFAIPLLLGNAFQQTYNLVDTAVIGNFVGPEALAGVGVASPLFNFLVSLLVGFSVGSSIVVARLFGARKDAEIHTAVSAIIMISSALAIALTFAGIALIDPLLVALGTPADAYPFARSYLEIIIAGMVFTVLYNQFSGILRGIGDSKTPLYFLVVSSLVNILLDIVFVVLMHQGVSGAAYATVVSQALSAILTGAFIFWKVPELRPNLAGVGMDGGMLKTIWRYGLPMGLQQSSISLGLVFMQGIVDLQGTAAIAAFASAAKVDMFAVMPIVSLGAALSTFSAQCIGAGDVERVREGLKVTNILSICLCIALSLLVVADRRFLVELFVPVGSSVLSDDIVDMGARFLLMVSSFYVVLSMVHNHLNVMAGAGDTIFYLVAMVFMMLFRVALAWFLVAVLGMDYRAIWASFPISWVVTLIPVLHRYFHGPWRRVV